MTRSGKLRNNRKHSNTLIQEKIVQEEAPRMEPSAILNLLPNFEGGEKQNFSNYLRQFDELTELAKLTPESKIVILKSKFRKTALEILENSEELQSEKDYSKFCKAANSKFSPRKDFVQIQAEFTGTRQKGEQTVQDFYEKCKTNATKFLNSSNLEKNKGAQDLIEKMLLSQFVNGLNPKLKFEVEKINPQKLEEAKILAQKSEKAYKNLEEQNQINDTQAEMFAHLLAQNRETQNKLEEITKNMNNLQLDTPKKEFQELKCEICLKRHETKNCWENPRNRIGNFRRLPNRNYYGFRPQRFQYAGPPRNFLPREYGYQQPITYRQENFPAITYHNQPDYTVQFPTPNSQNRYNKGNKKRNKYSGPIIEELKENPLN